MAIVTTVLMLATAYLNAPVPLTVSFIIGDIIVILNAVLTVAKNQETATT